MAKAINWPAQFREEILLEDCEHPRIALRLGTLYYDNQYWAPDEIVDIRVEQKKVRQARILGELRQCPIRALTDGDFRCLKRSLQTPQAVIRFLSETYQQPVDEDTLVTVVTYQNHPVIPDEVE
ncbi:MAG TPA: hypothetical protein V6C99_01610 [Oculatellaceae cyanobacterium]|jgi:hypothetical protein